MTGRATMRTRWAAALAALLVLLAPNLRGNQEGAYVAPQSGWLWVVDSDNFGADGRVLLVDPAARRVVSSLRAGFQPDIALSLDGSRLYLAYSTRDQRRGFLEVIDTANGAVLQQLETPDRYLTIGPVHTSKLALSKDGRWLYQYRSSDTRYQSVYYIATFDTERHAFLPERAVVPLCEAGELISLQEPLRVGLMCSRTQDLRLIEIAPNGSLLRKTPPRVVVTDDEKQGQYPSVGFVSADGQRLVVLNGDGRLTKADSGLRVLERGAVDQQSRGIEPSGPVRVPEGVRPAATDPRNWLAGKRIRQHPAMLSTDGTRVYLGVGRRGPHGGGVWLDEIVIADAATLVRIGSIAPRLPFFSFLVDRGGSRLFTVATPSAEILVLDVTNGNEVASIPVGRTPVFAVQAP